MNYYNENDPKAVAWLRELIARGLISEGPDSLNATSLPGSADGAMRSDSPAGPTINLSGPEAAPASPSVPPASISAPQMSAISGPSSAASSRSVALQASLESRLRARLAVDGSPEYALTWKHWAMESGPPICALRASGHRISDSGFTGWPTPNAPRAHDSDNTAGKPYTTKRQVCIENILAGWATPTAHDYRSGSMTPEKKLERDAHPRGKSLSEQTGGALNPEFVCWLMGYPPGWCDCAVTAMPSSRKSRPRS